MKAYRYERRGLLALDPKALLEVFFVGDGAKDNQETGDCVIVDVRGPLEQHAHPWCDSYESILARVEAACATSARAVVLRFDSPGGDAAGCFEAADEIRAACDKVQKQLHAYVDGDCCSAAYALACRADSITMSATSLVGSIGVMSCREDMSAMNAARGLRVALITSGARKADGHPDQPITEAELAQTQSVVDSLASLFFMMVGKARKLPAESVAQLEAKVLPGPAALAAGLVDEIGPLASVFARVAGVATGDKSTMASAYEKARAALQEAAEGDDANAKAAQRALAAMEPGEESEGEGEDGEAKEDGETSAEDAQEDKPAASAPVAEGEDDPAKDPAAKSAAAALRAAFKAEQRVTKLEAELRERDERDERKRLIASRPGLSPEMVALLERAPMALVRDTIKETAADAAPGTDATLRAPTQGAHGARLTPDAKADLDARMGLLGTKAAAVNTEHTLRLGVRQVERS